MQSAQTGTRDGDSWRRVGVLAQWWEGQDGGWHGWAPLQKPKAKKSGNEQPLEQVIHAANVWIRACEINMFRNFEDLAPVVDGEDMSFFSDPPQSFLDAAPDYGKACIKRQLSALPLIQRLLTPAERAAMLTDADRQAERVYRRAGMDVFDALAESGFEECWCAWVVEEVERALAYVAIGGMPLSTSVPATLDPWHDSDWAKSKRYLPRCTMNLWLERHEKWLGAPMITLFRTARARVVEATLCSSSGEIPQPSHIKASASRSAAAVTTTVRTGAGARAATKDVAPSTLLATDSTLNILATAATTQTAPPLAFQAATTVGLTTDASTIHSSAAASSDDIDEAPATTGTRKRTTKAWVRTDRVVTRGRLDCISVLWACVMLSPVQGAGARTVTKGVAPSTLLAASMTLDIFATAATTQAAPHLAFQAATTVGLTTDASTIHSSAAASSDDTDEAPASTGTRKRTTKAWVRTDRVVTRRTAKARTLVAARDRVLSELFLVKLIAEF